MVVACFCAGLYQVTSRAVTLVFHYKTHPGKYDAFFVFVGLRFSLIKEYIYKMSAGLEFPRSNLRPVIYIVPESNFIFRR